MSLPIVILCGRAGSGKDAVAESVKRQFKAQSLAIADPMKRFAKLVFEFTDDQLWGPSEKRNEPDARYLQRREWIRTFNRMTYVGTTAFNEKLFPDVDSNLLRSWLSDWFKQICVEHDVDLWDVKKESTNPLTPRLVLQRYGTEFGRSIDPGAWPRIAVQAALQLLAGGSTYSRSEGVVKSDSSGPDLVVVTDGRFRDEVVAVKAIGGLAIKVENPAEAAPAPGQHASENLSAIPDHFYDAVLVNDKSAGFGKLDLAVKEMIKDNVFNNDYVANYGKWWSY